MYEQVVHYHKVGINRINNENTFHKKKHLTLFRQELQIEKRREGLGNVWERKLGKGLGGENAWKWFGREGLESLNKRRLWCYAQLSIQYNSKGS